MMAAVVVKPSSLQESLCDWLLPVLMVPSVMEAERSATLRLNSLASAQALAKLSGLPFFSSIPFQYVTVVPFGVRIESCSLDSVGEPCGAVLALVVATLEHSSAAHHCFGYLGYVSALLFGVLGNLVYYPPL